MKELELSDVMQCMTGEAILLLAEHYRRECSLENTELREEVYILNRQVNTLNEVIVSLKGDILELTMEQMKTARNGLGTIQDGDYDDDWAVVRADRTCDDGKQGECFARLQRAVKESEWLESEWLLEALDMWRESSDSVACAALDKLFHYTEPTP